jgi:hypothetical protein
VRLTVFNLKEVSCGFPGYGFACYLMSSVEAILCREEGERDCRPDGARAQRVND